MLNKNGRNNLDLEGRLLKVSVIENSGVKGNYGQQTQYTRHETKQQKL
jgi:hypothetical protein